MKKIPLFLLALLSFVSMNGQCFMLNVQGRDNISLNGKWDAIIDVYDKGESSGFYRDPVPLCNTDFIESSFDNGLRLDVPSDWNSQFPELQYYEGKIWYRRVFHADKRDNERQYLYFEGANYQAKVWLNGCYLGEHQGGFTPFEFEVSEQLLAGQNKLIVSVDNTRRPENIPAMRFDWWNYGGITRNVHLVSTPELYVRDYLLQLVPDSRNELGGYVKLNDSVVGCKVECLIPELGVRHEVRTDASGYAELAIRSNPVRWSPDNPKLYDVLFVFQGDTVRDEIGFRTISVEGDKILLNGSPVYLRGINCHEEIPQRMGRASSMADVSMLLSEVQALGCNFLRLTHYPQSELMVREAEKRGLMMWEEIPVWGQIDFANEQLMSKAEKMMQDMIRRDKNRAGIVIWSIANETLPKAPGRTEVLTRLAKSVHAMDSTRLLSAAFNNMEYDSITSTYTLNDQLVRYLDVVSINEYLGWYNAFPISPEKIFWEICLDKPLLVSEFGGEAMFGIHGTPEVAHSWSEDFQAELYRKNLIMFDNIPNLCGICPWVLFDFRSPTRLHPIYQDGWNRKGLLSDKAQRKKAWYVIKAYYQNK